LLAERGLARTVDVAAAGGKARLRWQAERPGALWHGDVCHGPTLTLEGRRVPIRVHGLLDDASRYVVALRVASDEREHTMLTLFAQALMAHGKCDALYLDKAPLTEARSCNSAARASVSRCFTPSRMTHP